MINAFLKEQIENKIKNSNKKYKSYIFKEAYMLDKYGVSNNKSLKVFHYASQYVPIFLKNIFGEYNKKIMSDVLFYIMSDYNNIKCSNDIKEKIIKYFSQSKFIKKAYPNYGEDINPKKYNLNKWKTALNDIIIREKLYGSFREAFDYITKDWRDMDEKLDFNNWVKDQKRGINKLYRIAYSDNMLEFQHIPGLTSNVKKDTEDYSKSTKSRDEIVKQKVLGRINSIKKILSTRDGPHLLGKDYSKIMKSILDLEGDILGIRTASMIQDVIYRTANILKESECDENILQYLNKTAQMPSLDDMNLDDPMSSETSKTNESKSTDDAGDGKLALDTFIERVRGYPSPDMNPNKIKEKFDDIIENFKEKTSSHKWYNINTKEVLELEEISENISKIARLVKFAKNRDNRIKLAQDVSPEITTDTPPDTFVPDKPEEEIPIETIDPKTIAPEEAKVKPEKENQQIKPSSVDKLDMEAIFPNIKISDVVDRLKALSKVFQNREIARQLSIVDLMLDALGLSGFFPSLAEATKSALDSNQYCQSRIEEILSRLISSVNDEGESMINYDVLNKNKRPESIIDKEMEQYLNEEEPTEIKNKPTPVKEKAEEAIIPEQKPVQEQVVNKPETVPTV
jgi:hypothetical protein